MKHIKSLCSILCCLILCTVLTITVSADTTLPFTREEAYDKIMNMEADDAVRAFGGKEEYINALSQSDKDYLFDVLWKMQEDGVADEPDAYYFAEEYYSCIISAFHKADSTEEGLNNLYQAIADSGYGTMPQQTSTTTKDTDPNASTNPGSSDNNDQTTTTSTATTAAQQSSDGPSAWIWILAIAAFGVLGIAIYFMFRKKK